MDFANIINYEGNSITLMSDGVTVFYEGEELYFESVDEAKNFIDGITN